MSGSGDEAPGNSATNPEVTSPATLTAAMNTECPNPSSMLAMSTEQIIHSRPELVSPKVSTPLMPRARANRHRT